MRNTNANTSGTISTNPYNILDIKMISTLRENQSELQRVPFPVSSLRRAKWVLSSTRTKRSIYCHRTESIPTEVRTVNEFIYLGTAVNSVHNISAEIKRRITIAYRCFFGLNKQLRNKDLSRSPGLAVRRRSMDLIPDG